MAPAGRYRTFDREKALDAALEVFWRHGYEGASVAELTQAMGINRPALYAAYRGKKDLFFRAVDRYNAVHAVHTLLALKEPTAQRATQRYLLRSVEQFTDPDRPLGCFVLQGALVCAPENSDVAAYMAGLRRTAETELRKRYEQALHDGDLPQAEDPAALALYVCVLRHGLAVMACSGATRAELNDSVDRALDGMTTRIAGGGR